MKNSHINLQKNQELKLKIDGYTSKSFGVAHYKSIAIFVKNAIKNEEILAKIVKVERSFAWAIIVKIYKTSKFRSIPKCKHYKFCGGCSLEHIKYNEQTSFKAEKINNALKRIGNLNIKVNKVIPCDNQFNYRNKASFPVRDGKIGMFKPRSHDVIDIDNCLLQENIINKTLHYLRLWIEKYNISSYNETTHKGILRELIIRANYKNDVMICLVVNKDNLPYTKELINYINQHIPECKSIAKNINTTKNNNILSNDTSLVYGRLFIEDKILNLKFRIDVNSFFQVNRDGVEKIFKVICDFVSLNKNDVALDLYCGVGTITLLLAQRLKFVYGIEVVESAIKNANENSKLNNINNIKFICENIYKTSLKSIFNDQKIDIVCVDPPRKGLSSHVIEQICDLKPKKIIYVSCNPETLARDLKQFSNPQNSNNSNATVNYKIEKICAVDMFPQTYHVESVVLLNRTK